MHKYLNMLALGSAMTFGAHGAFANDPFFPSFGNVGIDVQHYNIDLDVDPVSGRVAGQSSLVIEAEHQLSSFTLDLHALAVKRVRVNGRPAFFSQANDKLSISGFGSINKGRVFAVTVSYEGVPDALPDPTASPDDGFFLGWFKYLNSTYVVSEPIGASTFFPANDDITDKATYTFGITVPNGYTGVANGRPIATLKLGAKKRFQWAMLQPMEAWLATVHVNKFNVKTVRTTNGIPVRAYYPDGVPETHADVYLSASQMIPYFESLIGPYPFQSYGTAVTQDPQLDYFLETQAMSTFPAEGGLPRESIVAHELAHQWFGNSVSVAKWEDLWIAEGLATYFEMLWRNRKDQVAFDAAQLGNYDFVVSENLGPAVVEAPDQLFSDRTYFRGAAAVYALQLKVGQQTLFRILRQFVQWNKGGTVTSEDFIRTAVRVSGDQSVRPLLHAWLYEQGVPALPGAVASAARSAARSAPAPEPNLLGSRCGHGRHRGAKKVCE